MPLSVLSGGTVFLIKKSYLPKPRQDSISRPTGNSANEDKTTRPRRQNCQRCRPRLRRFELTACEIESS
jgi:hypothetical protein